MTTVCTAGGWSWAPQSPRDHGLSVGKRPQTRQRSMITWPCRPPAVPRRAAALIEGFLGWFVEATDPRKPSINESRTAGERDLGVDHGAAGLAGARTARRRERRPGPRRTSR